MASFTVNFEITAEFDLDDDAVDWEQRARENGYASVEDMVKNLAYWVCIDGLDCPRLDGYADLPRTAAVNRGTDVTDTTVERTQ